MDFIIRKSEKYKYYLTYSCGYSNRVPIFQKKEFSTN